MMAGLDHTRKMMLKIVLTMLTCSYLELFGMPNKKNNVAVLMCVAGWIRAKVTKRGLVTIPSLKVDRLLCERAAQLSSPLLYWKDIAVQLGKTLPAVQLCTFLVQFSAKISSPLLHEDTAVQNFVLCTTLV